MPTCVTSTPKNGAGIIKAVDSIRPSKGTSIIWLWLVSLFSEIVIFMLLIVLKCLSHFEHD